MDEPLGGQRGEEEDRERGGRRRRRRRRRAEGQREGQQDAEGEEGEAAAASRVEWLQSRRSNTLTDPLSHILHCRSTHTPLNRFSLLHNHKL